MSTVDFKKEYKHLYGPSAKDVSVVEMPTLHYLMVDGEGAPKMELAYGTAVKALYTLAYGIRKVAGCPFVVMPLEGLWWFKDDAYPTVFQLTAADKANFVWRLMIMQPPFVTAEMVEEARAGVGGLDQVRFEAYEEGTVAQILHIGSYDDEGPTVERLHTYIEDNGYHLSGRHHEIYLSDPRRVAPEKLKTIIRQPFVVVGQAEYLHT